MATDAELSPGNEGLRPRPFRTAVIRGLAGLLAPLLTVVILLWIWQTLKYYVLEPVETATRNFIAWQISDIYDDVPPGARPVANEPGVFEIEGRDYRRLPTGQLIPREVHDAVVRQSADVPVRGRDFYRRWVEIQYLKPWIVVPLFLVIFFAAMYLLGSVFAAGIGHVFWTLVEGSLEKVPFVRAVYGPVKQVTEYMLSEQKPEFRRVVAVEYPRRGVWTLAFVTGEGMTDVQKISGEPMLTVLFPTSPTPIAGNTKMVPRRETIDLAMNVDQAVQYILSYGVVVPEPQVRTLQSNAPAESNGALTTDDSPIPALERPID